MRALLCLLLLITLNVSVWAGVGVIHFKILPGKLHQGGKVSAELVSTNPQNQTMIVRFAYEIIKKPLVPAPSEYLKGGMDQELPLEFLDERGYLNLEARQTMELPDATLIYLGRSTVAGLENGHLVKIKAKNGRSDTEIYYHPHLPEMGWGRVKLTIFTPLPIFSNYSMEAVLVN